MVDTSDHARPAPTMGTLIAPCEALDAAGALTEGALARDVVVRSADGVRRAALSAVLGPGPTLLVFLRHFG